MGIDPDDDPYYNDPLLARGFPVADGWYGDGSREKALALVKGPAEGLVLCGLLGGVVALCVAAGVWFDALGTRGADAQDEKYLIAAWFAALVVCSAVVMAGGLRMRKLRGYKLAVTAAVMAVVSLLLYPGCGLVGGGVGIWALVALGGRAVRQQFALTKLGSGLDENM